ncbi:ATP-binding cassette domain-containing protein [Roseomonas sp. BN140053]|uniref:ATP-binding cassette domain-containing protein n=1 Tax=Roseomonas sp. BN140053 TaxID=3391898 RepID=UPI0039ECF00D
MSGGPAAPPLLEAREVIKLFPVRACQRLFARTAMQSAVTEASVTIHPGETVALVGESGSGKSTLGRMLLGLTAPSGGTILYRGRALAKLDEAARRAFRREVQVVFQDTGASLNPRRTVGQSVALPLQHNLDVWGEEARRRADGLLDLVGLSPARFRDRLPHELSGGQRQRVGIARALASDPAVIIADEPVSALDVSVRAQLLGLMHALRQQRQLAYLFITHDLGVVRALADRVMVMQGGRVVEQGTADAVLEDPRHDYTRRLLAATPVPDPGRQAARLAQAVAGRRG